jgi:predicted TIM-barrel fold metal-dependent hydrolase
LISCAHYAKTCKQLKLGATMRWIDSHVHLFSDNDSDNSGMPLVFGTDSLNTPDLYLKMLGENHPAGVVIVDFSKSNDSEHVINSLTELKQKNIKAAGVIKANLNDPNTLKWIQNPLVKAIRIYAKESVPDLSGSQWADVFAKIKQNHQHILVFGDGENLLSTLKQIPDDITILIDHLGIQKPNADTSFDELLEIAKQRGNVYFKGPGYRTSLDAQKVKPIVRKIIEKIGINRLILGASDAPFAGPAPEYEGKKFCELINYETVLRFIEELANSVTKNDQEKERILYANAKELYGF